MSREIALAYGVAGLSLAIAVVAVAGSTVGLLSVPEPQVAEAPAQWTAEAVPTVRELAAGPVALVDDLSSAPLSSDATPDDMVEVVYVDEPRRRGHDDDDDDWEEEDDDDRWEGRRGHGDDDRWDGRREHDDERGEHHRRRGERDDD